MGSGVPDEIIRVRWVAEFKDNARGLITSARRATAELSKAHRTQRREQEQTAKATRQFADEIEDLGKKYQRAANLTRARPLISKKQLQELVLLRRELKAQGVELQKSDRLYGALAKHGIKEYVTQQRTAAREARRLARDMGLSREEARKSIAAFGDNTAALRAFRARTKEAKDEVADFVGEKRKEVAVLRDNRKALGDNVGFLGRFASFVRNAGGALRFSTNEMILWNRTTRLLRVPAVLAFLGMFIQLLSAAAAGITGFVSALRPLVGLLAALPAVMASAIQVMQVWKIATTNLGKSSLDLGKIIETSLIANTEDFKSMMEDLPKRAQSFARFLRNEITPGFRELRAELQANIFRGLEVGLKRALPSLRAIRPEFVETSAVIERFLIALGTRAGRRDWAADLETQAKRTNDWMRKMIPVALNLADGIRHVTMAAAPLVDHIVKLSTRGARWFEEWAQAGRTTGRFAAFFRETNFVLDETLSLLGSFGSGLNNILSVAYQSIGKDILVDLTNASQAFKAWTDSAAGRNAIAQYFIDMKDPIYEASRLIRDLVKGMFRLGRQPGVANLIRQLRTELGPALGEAISSVTQNFGPALVTFLTEMVKLMAVLAGASGPLTAVIEAFTDMARIFRTILTEFPLLSKFFLELVAATAILRGIRFIAAISGVGMLIRMVGTLATSLRVAWTEAATLNRTMAMAPAAGAPMMHPRAAPGVMGATGAGRFSRFGSMIGRGLASPMATGIIGTGAMVGGLMLGGRGGAALAGAGVGLQVGAMFGPWGAAIGTAVGALGGFTAAVLLAKDSIGETAKATANLGGAASLLGAAQKREKAAARGVTEAGLGLEQAQIDVRGARQFRRSLLAGVEGKDRERVKRSDEYRQAVLNEKQAVLALEDAELRLAQARKDREAATRKTMEREKILDQRMREVGQAARDNIAGIMEETRRPMKGESAQENVEERTRRIREAVEGYQEAMGRLAQRMRSEGNPELARYAETAQKLSKTINGIPKKVDIDAVFKVDKSALGRGGTYDIVENRRASFWATVNVSYAVQGPPPPGVSMGVWKASRLGGMVTGPRTRDAVPIMAAGGEAILTADGQRMVESLGGRGAMDFILQRQRPHFGAGAGSGSTNAGGMAPWAGFAFASGGRVPAHRNVGQHTAFDRLPTKWEINLEGLLFGNKKQVENALKSLGGQIRNASIGMIEDVIVKIDRQIKRMRRGGLTENEKKRIKNLRQARTKATGRAESIFDRITERGGFAADMAGAGLRQLELQQALAGTFDTGGAERAEFIRARIIPALTGQLTALQRELRFAERTGNTKRERELRLELENKKIELLEAQLEAQEAANSILQELASPMSFEFGGQRWTDLMQSGVGI